MLDDDALWGSGGAGGVDDVGRVLRIGRRLWRGRRPPRDLRPVGVEPHQGGGRSDRQPRQQAGLVHALECLARGEPVAQVSDALGYATPSNFIAMFRRTFGESPARYFAARRESQAADFVGR